MSHAETVESYLHRSEFPYEQIDPETWILLLPNARKSRVILRVDAPIILITTAILDLHEDTQDRESLFRTLLELNNELMHGSYALQDQRVVLSGAQLLTNFDQHELLAILDDMSMAIDTHEHRLAQWKTVTHASEESRG